ncbi:hypothetical protein HDV00_002148 [Rhizophlyctis rosea]|nr:hypothetical protein HDV00_002148 [Rhizophlyctis rosea]
MSWDKLLKAPFRQIFLWMEVIGPKPTTMPKMLHCHQNIRKANVGRHVDMYSKEEKVFTDVVTSMRATVATVLDFVIDTLAESPADLTAPESAESIRSINVPETDEEDALAKDNKWQYACILWNDEVHSFQEVIDIVMAALDCSVEEAKDVATRVDAHGRDIIFLSESLTRLLSMSRVLTPIGLAVSIRNARDTFREYIAGLLIGWLRDLPRLVPGSRRMHGVLFESVQNVVRRVICEELCAQRRNVKDILVGWKNGAASASAGEEDVDLYDRDVDPQDPINLDEDVDAVMQGYIEVEDDDELFSRAPDDGKLRIDYLLAYDVKLWKELRNSLRELYIGTLIVSADEFKKVMGIRFAHNYLRIANSFLFHDRENDLSIINFSVQLFTVPTIAQYLVSHTNLVPCLFAILKAFYLAEREPEVFNLKQFYTAYRRARKFIRPHYRKLTCESDASRNRPYWHVFADLRYILLAHKVRDETLRHFPTDLLRFLDLCRVWQGMHPQERYTRSHVEYETETWMHAFKLSLQVSRLVTMMSDCYHPVGNTAQDVEVLVFAINTTISVIDRWCAYEQAEEVVQSQLQQRVAVGTGVDSNRRMTSPDGSHVVEIAPGVRMRVPFFRVSSQTVSFHHPLHWFLAQLLAHVPKVLGRIEDVQVRKGVWRRLFAFDGVSVEGDAIEDVAEGPIIPQPGSENAEGVSAEGLPPQGRRMSVFDSPESQRELKRTVATKSLSRQEHLARMFDYPLRIAVWLSQIRAGIWVRNGFSVRSQALHYREVTLRDCYDQELFLLQTAAVLQGSDKFMTTLLDRYDLVAWFQGRPREASTLTGLEPGQLTHLAEDLMQLLIIILTERSKAGAMDLEQETRREIVHHLAVNPSGMAYSELTKRIPDRLIDASANVSPDAKGQKSFDEILSELAVFKFPDGMADHGLYELKDEYYSEVDPWFWHYTRNQREDVEEVLKKRAEAKKGGKKAVGKKRVAPGNGEKGEDEDVRVPKLIPLTEGGGYDGLVGVVRGNVFVRLLFFALWNVGRKQEEGGDAPVRSDAVLAATVHILLVALEMEVAHEAQEGQGGLTFLDLVADLEIEDVGKAGVDGHLTLLELILGLVDRADEDEIKEHAPRLRYFVRRLEEIGSVKARNLIAGWRDKSRWGTSAEDAARAAAASAGDEMSEQERKKLASKARQAAIMAQFAQAQKSFMANYGDDMEDIEGEEEEDYEMEEGEAIDGGPETKPEERTWNYPTGTCIVCQEETGKGGLLYGMLGFIQPSCIQRHINFADGDAVERVLSAPSSLDVEHPRPDAAASSSSLHPPSTPQSARMSTSPSSSSLSATRRLSTTLTGSTPHYPFAAGESVLGPPLPTQLADTGLYASSCGHLMHFTCFQSYSASVEARQQAQPTRNHPERIDKKEFMCPLCKSLGNCLLPVLWSGKTEKVNWAGSSVPWKEVDGGREKGGLEGLDEWWGSGVGDSVKAIASGYHGGDYEMHEAGTKRARSGSDIARRFDGVVSHFLPDLQREGAGSPVPQRRGEHARGGAVAAPISATNVEAIRQIYGDRLMDTVRLTYRNVIPDYDGEEAGLESLELLWELMGYTISGVEIMARGVGVPGAMAGGYRGKGGLRLTRVGVLDGLSPQVLTLLRVFSETVVTYTSVVVCDGETEGRMRRRVAVFLQSLFRGFVEEKGKGPSLESGEGAFEERIFTPLLDDSFDIFVEMAMGVGPVVGEGGADVWEWVKVFWVLEVVKCVVAVGESVGVRGEMWSSEEGVRGVVERAMSGGVEGKGKKPVYGDEDVRMGEGGGGDGDSDQIMWFVEWVLVQLGMGLERRRRVLDSVDPKIVLRLCETVGLTFMRKVVLLLYARFGIVPPGGPAGLGFDDAPADGSDYESMGSENGEETEYRRLLAYLRLPPVTSVCSPQTVQSPFLSRLIAGWCKEATMYEPGHFTGDTPSPSTAMQQDHTHAISIPRPTHHSARFSDTDIDRLATLNTPVVFELMPLPRRLDTLFEESLRRVCKRCNTVPADPALCLLCGTFVCSQSFCCSDEDRGECNIHAKTCGGDVGLYLLIKKCIVLILHGDNGNFMNPPYLDAHGEVDVGLRRGRPQYLNMRRYDEIRKLWLTHGIPSFVARKIEQSIDFGGWPTL